MVAAYDYSVADDPASARPSEEAVRVGRRIASCVVQQRPELASRYLTARSNDERKAGYARITPLMPGCLAMAGGLNATRASFSAASFQGSLGEALIARRQAMNLLATEPSKTDMPYWLSEDAGQRVVQEMAICLAARLPDQATALVRSKPDGPDELAAFSAIAPAMGPCLIKGTTLRANRTGVRLAIASAIYHRMTDVSDTGTSEAKK